jgi:sugar phosphate isomerase/epimerase
MSGGTAAVHPAAVVNPLADMGAPLEAELELCAELGGARYGLSLNKLARWDGPLASLADRIAYVHHSRLFTLDDESAWSAERAALSRTLELAHEIRAPSILAVTGPAGSLRTWEQADAVPTSVSMPDRVVPGDGTVPLGWLVEQIAATGYRGYFDIELLGPRIDAEGARQRRCARSSCPARAASARRAARISSTRSPIWTTSTT